MDEPRPHPPLLSSAEHPIRGQAYPKTTRRSHSPQVRAHSSSRAPLWRSSPRPCPQEERKLRKEEKQRVNAREKTKAGRDGEGGGGVRGEGARPVVYKENRGRRA